jgi:hypothetical protein
MTDTNITKVLSAIADKARKERRPLPIISVPVWDIAEIAWAIERDIGGKIYADINPYRGFSFNGIEFRPVH